MGVKNTRIQIDQISQDKTNNFSTVRVRGYASTYGGTFNDYGKYGTYILDGQEYSFFAKLPLQTSNILLFDAQHPVYHNPDGTKTVTASFSMPTGTSAGTISANAELTLTTIPRTTPCPYSTFFIDTDTTYSINPASSSFSHVLNYFYNGQEYWLATFPQGQAEIQFHVPNVFYSYIPDSNSIELPIKLYTYEGEPYSGTLIGASESVGNFAISIYNDTSPKVNSITVVDINEKTIALTGDANKIINHHSTVQTTVDAYSPSSANLTNYAVGFKIDDSNYGYYEGFTNNVMQVPNFSFPDDTTSKILSVYVQDSRGKRSASETDITDKVVNYFNIVLMDETTLGGSYVAFARPQIFSEKMKIGFAGEYWKGNFGAKENILSIKWRVKPNKENFSDWQTMTPNVDYLDREGFLPNYQYFGTGDIEPYIEEDGSENYRYYPVEIKNPLTEDGIWDYLTTYTFEVEISDELTTHSFTRVVYPSNPILSWYEDGEKLNNVEIHGRLKVDEDIYARNLYGAKSEITDMYSTNLNSTNANFNLVNSSYGNIGNFNATWGQLGRFSYGDNGAYLTDANGQIKVGVEQNAMWITDGTYQTKITPTGIEKHENVLYENWYGTVDTINLTNNPQYFKYIEIYYQDNNGRERSSMKVWNGYNPSFDVDVFLIEAGSTSGTLVRRTRLTFNHQTVTFSNGAYLTHTSSGSNHYAGNYIYVTRIVGRND